jgi:undecaprenyl pyrophosphate phosphatase UppP
MESCWPHDAGDGFPSEKLHELTRKSRELDNVRLSIAQYRQGVWLVILAKMTVFMIVSIVVGLPGKTSLEEWILSLGVVIVLLFIVSRMCLRTSRHPERIR